MAPGLVLVHSPLVGCATWDLVAADLAGPQWPDAPGAYLLLSEAYQDQAARARELGWPVAEQMSHHLALLTESGRVAGSLCELIGQLGR
jgi:hypothetical protein